MKNHSILLCTCIVSLLITLSACSTPNVETEQVSDTSPSQAVENTTKPVKSYEDLRYFEGSGRKKSFEQSEYNVDDIVSFTFNQDTVLIGNEELQAQTMENGKNPGLGIRDIHDKGITGKGVKVAIIDQNLLLNHPEFSGKITAYYDTGCEQEEGVGSMHAPAVTSLLVGNTVGVAPDAEVYFAAAPSWENDSEFYAKGLYWLIEENKKLPDNEKIRVVSVSASPSGGEGSPFTKNLNMWNEAVLAAQNEGILVLDCRNDKKTGIFGPAFYNPVSPDDVSMCTGGFPATPRQVPASYRTVAEEYMEGSPSYQYTGQGGSSWATPYAAGVLALGWQINPNLENEQIIQILFDTCFIVQDGSKIINPAAFIDAVEATPK